MKIWYNEPGVNERKVLEFTGDRIRIGRDADNDLVLNSQLVAPEHAVLARQCADWEVIALGFNGIHVGDRELPGGDRMLIGTEREIGIFPFTLTLDLPRTTQASRQVIRRQLDEEMSALIQAVHKAYVNTMDEDFAVHAKEITDAELVRVEQTIDDIAKDQNLLKREKKSLVTHLAGHALRSHLLSSLTEVAASEFEHELLADQQWSRFVSAVPDREDELDGAARRMESKLEIDEKMLLTDKIQAVDSGFWDLWDELADRGFHVDFKRYLAFRFLKKEIKDTVFGYGPIQDLLRLPTVSEIMVVDKDHIFVENAGVIENSGRRFVDDEITKTIIQQIVSLVGRQINMSEPLVDARLLSGDRVNAVIPPIAVSGPCLTIRKFPHRKLLIDDLVAKGALTYTVAEFLRAVVLKRCNIIVSGGTGTGKTTLLNCLSDFIPDKERIVTIEDTAELQLMKEHVVRLETKPANIEGAGEYTIGDLVKNALRMRPDRVVVGECRGPEALDMLQAMNTGHDGSLTTIHANNAEDVILRLEVLVQMAADLPIQSIHRQIASAVDLIVQLHRMRSGRRCISQIAEITGIDPITGSVRMRDLYRLDAEERQGARLVATGHLPTFMPELIERKLIDLDAYFGTPVAENV